MAHLTSRSGYTKLIDRINKFPQGAPASQTLYKILRLLFTHKEAELVSQLPITPFHLEDAACIWKISKLDARKILDELTSKAVLLDIEKNGDITYALPPPMAGFFEFTLMRTGGKVDQKLISELFHQYLHVEDEFIYDLFASTKTSFMRTFVNEKALNNNNAIYVLDFERASHVIENASFIGVGMCYCRHKKQHLGTACDAPMDICMTFGDTSASLSKHGYARKIDKIEGLELLHKAQEHNLVQLGENAQNDVGFICNCCGCCCEALSAARKFAFLSPVHTTNFLPHVNEEECNGCGKCVDVCSVEAINLVSTNNANKKREKKASVDDSRCLGCGVCVTKCTKDALLLKSLPKRIITPVNSAHKVVMMAIEKGKLQNLIFDNQALWNHRMMAAILGAILKLPPIKQIMASEQIKSRYFGKLLENY